MEADYLFAYCFAAGYLLAAVLSIYLVKEKHHDEKTKV